LVICNFRFY